MRLASGVILNRAQGERGVFMSGIPWYISDPRFEPGTVADLNNYRISIRQNAKGWAVYAAFRKSDGSLAQRCKVVQLGRKSTKADARKEVEKWV